MFNQLPVVTKALLWINALLLLLPYVSEPLYMVLALWPVGSDFFLPWQLVTYGFLHGGVGHLFFNMLALFMFGAEVEYRWGSRRFLQFYLACVVGAGITHMVMSGVMGVPPGPLVGASGGVFGVLLAYGMMFPDRQVMLLIPPIPMRAKNLVILMGAVTLVLGYLQPGGGVAHFAHLGGMLVGFLMIQFWRKRWPFGGNRPRGGPWRPN